MREAVALQDECAALCGALEPWRRAAGTSPRTIPGAASPAHATARPPPLAGAPPPPPGAPLAAVLAAAERALQKIQPRVEALIREQDGTHA
jgi:hypothetical protein